MIAAVDGSGQWGSSVLEGDSSGGKAVFLSLTSVTVQLYRGHVQAGVGEPVEMLSDYMGGQHSVI